MKILALVLFGILLIASCLSALAEPQSSPAPKQSKPVSPGDATQGDDGERRFKENCGRCHNPPDSISPREAKAVVRHMRVRAPLTAEDEKKILKFLAP